MNDKNNHKYDDIINLPHHVSAARPHMSMHDRAAQFSPFAALTGYSDCIGETARLTDERLELSDEKITVLNQKTAFLMEHSGERPEISVEYFIPDGKKAGGRYSVISGNFKGIDQISQNMIFTSGEGIPLENIFDIEIKKCTQKFGL